MLKKKELDWFNLPTELNLIKAYKPRWLSKDQAVEIVNLYHLARCPLSGGNDTPYERMLWASKHFSIKYPEISSTAAYKDLCGILGR